MSTEHAPRRRDEPDRLPGESRSAYRRRTDRRYAAYRNRRNAGNRDTRADRRLALLRSGEITEAQYAERQAEADAAHDRSRSVDAG